MLRVPRCAGSTDFIAQATDFLRVDPAYDCGITGGLKIARIAVGFGVDAEMHAPGPARRHLMAALRNANDDEMALIDHLSKKDKR